MRRARIAQIVLGMIWLIDGLLQFQPSFFGRAFVTDVLLPNAAGQPGVISGPITWIADVIAPHVAVFNGFAAVLQVAIGLSLIAGRMVRPALAVSFVWGAGIWFVGEGLGAIFTGTANPLTGAPGAALLYVLAGLMCWPRAGGDGLGLIGVRGARWAWAAIWLGSAALWLAPANRGPGAVQSAIASVPTGAGWLDHIVVWAASATAGDGTPIAILMAVLSAAIACAVLAEIDAGLFLGLAIVISLVFWIVGQGLGGVFTGQATDVNSAPLMMLIASMLLGARTLRTRRAPAWPGAARTARRVGVVGLSAADHAR